MCFCISAWILSWCRYAALSYNHLLGYLHCIKPNSLMGWNMLETWSRLSGSSEPVYIVDFNFMIDYVHGTNDRLHSCKVWLIERCCMSVQVSEVIIPTAESACQSFFLKMMLEAKIPVLFVGPNGTGKSAVTLNYLSSLPRDKFICSVVNFSARTSANQTQEVIMSKLDRYFTLSC